MRKSDFTLPTLDDLFSTQAERDDAKLERVRNIPLAELHPFKGHPFKVQNNEEMQRMIESIHKVGAITPALARPLPDGGYELISGHRRLAACQVLGVETIACQGHPRLWFSPLAAGIAGKIHEGTLRLHRPPGKDLSLG